MISLFEINNKILFEKILRNYHLFLKMLAARLREIGFRQTVTVCTVPNNNMARLMYYLSSVDSLTDFGIPYELKNYDNYNNLSFDQENQVIALAFLLSPDVFIERGIMINEPRLCGNCNNEFYEISDSRTAVAATREFVIAGKQVRTLKIMAFKMAWIENHFVQPINYYDRRLKAIANGTVERLRPKQITYNRLSTNYNSNYTPPRNYVTSSSYKKKKSKKCIIC